MPTSSTSAPARSSAHRISPERERSGSPAVTYVTRPVRCSARMRLNASAILDAKFCTFFRSNVPGDGFDVLVAAAGQIHENLSGRAKLLRQRAGIRDGMRRLQGRDDAFHPGKVLERGQRVVVANPRVLGTPQVPEPCMLRTDGRIIELGRD